MINTTRRIVAIIALSLLVGFPAASLADDKATVARQACKAGIAMLFGRDPEIIKIEKVSGGTVYLHYIRPDDGKKWKYKCKLDGDQVIWASNDPDSSGRWRTHPDDGVLTYQIQGSELRVQQMYSDGSREEASFPVSSL